MKRSLLLLVVAVATLAAVAGCGGGSTLTNPQAPARPAAPSAQGGIPALTGTPDDLSKPSRAMAGGGQPPATLMTEDVVVGTGPSAQPSNTVDVRYSGTLYTDGTLFDSSWSRGADPISFPLAGVVPGFAKGIEGMQPGGRRVIVIPPDQGYGARTNGPIPGGSTLVFVVDLVSTS